MKSFHLAAVVTALGVSSAGLLAQTQQAPAPGSNPAIQMAQELEAARMSSLVPVQVQVVIARYQGDRRVSSRPYQVSVNANGRPAQLRMGAQVPVPTMANPTIDGKPVTGMLQSNPVTYRDIGTNIDASAATVDRVQFEVTIGVEDTSVYLSSELVDGVLRTGDLPVFRTFRMENTAVLRDGQTTQFTAATDRISGELMRIEVTLTVAK